MVIPASIPLIYTLNPEGGNGVLWFVYLYIVGAYLRKYPIKLKKITCLSTSFLLLGLAYFSTIAIEYVSNRLGFGDKGLARLSTYDAFTIFGASIFIFLAVVQAKPIENNTIKKIVLFFSSSSLSVYLIHDNPNLRHIVWNLFEFSKIESLSLTILLICIVPLIIYLICTIVDKLSWRLIDKQLQKITIFDKASNFINQELDL